MRLLNNFKEENCIMLNKTKQFKKSESGFSIMEVLAAITIFGLMLPAVLMFFQMSNDVTTQKAAAIYMQQVGLAAEEYAQDNYAALIGAASPNVGASINIQTDLIAGNYLPPGFKLTNPWGQTYRAFAFEPSTNNLLVMIVTYNGDGYNPAKPKFATQTIPKTAAMIGAEGGYIPSGLLPGETQNMIKGSFGGWQFDLPGKIFTGSPKPQPGRLAYQKYFVGGNPASDYLHRTDGAVIGMPELNTMLTNLDMDGNVIEMGLGDVGGGTAEGVGRVNFEDQTVAAYPCTTAEENMGGVHFNNANGLYICRKGQRYNILDEGNNTSNDVVMSFDGGLITKPICPTGQTAKIFLAVSMASQDAIAKPLRAIQTWATDLGVRWQVNLRVTTRDGVMSPSSSFGRVVAITQCQ